MIDYERNHRQIFKGVIKNVYHYICLCKYVSMYLCMYLYLLFEFGLNIGKGSNNILSS